MMDTMSAYAMGRAARERGAPMNYFDGVKIKEIMEKDKVTEADIWLSQDREWTETHVTLKDGKLSAETMGVDGSVWATPMLETDSDEYEVGTLDHKRMTIDFTPH